MKRRLYIFPALIPLAEILPWLLALIGGTAGIMHHIRRFAGNRLLVAIAAISITIALAILGWNFIQRPGADEGSNMVAESSLPKAVEFNGPGNETTYPAGSNFSLLWYFDSKHEYLSTPVIHEGRLYIGASDGTFESYDAKTGRRFWGLRKSEGIFAPLAIDNTTGIGYQADGLHTALYSGLTAIELTSGKALWERRYRGHLESAPVVDTQKQRLYFSGGTQGFWALNAKDGDVIWHRPIGHMDIMPLMLDGTLFVPSWTERESPDMVFYAINPDNGKTVWETPLPGHPMEMAVTDGKGHLYLGSAHGQIAFDREDDAGWAHALDLKGNILWTKQLETMAVPEMSILPEAGLVFYSLKNGKLQALSTADGHIVWERNFNSEFFTSALLVTETKKPVLVAKMSNGQVTILDAIDGTPLSSFQIGENGYAASAYSDGILYMSDQNRLYAYQNLDQILESK